MKYRLARAVITARASRCERLGGQRSDRATTPSAFVITVSVVLATPLVLAVVAIASLVAGGVDGAGRTLIRIVPTILPVAVLTITPVMISLLAVVVPLSVVPVAVRLVSLGVVRPSMLLAGGLPC